MQIPRRVRFEKDIITRIVRTLPGKGKLNVLTGQEVTPDEVLGIAVISSGFRIINVAALLGVDPSCMEQYLQRKVGQKIYKGELLAYKAGGLFKDKKIITSPTDGIIDFINPNNGEIKISFLPKQVSLPAAVYGVIDFVDHIHNRVFIRTQITRIYGVFGTGRQRDGILHVLGAGQDLIDNRNISIKDAEHVLVGRCLIYKDAISAAISSNVSGIITGGINARDYRGMAGGRLSFPKKFDNDIGISLVVCEGFGSVPIGQDIFDLLSAYNQRFIFIDGNQALVSLPEFKSDCMVRIRRTQISPSLEIDTNSFQTKLVSREQIGIGARVRVIGVTYLGEQGKIISIDRTGTKLGSGLLSTLITIETKSRKIKVPWDNIEII